MTSLRSQLRLTKPSSRRLGTAALVLGLSALVHSVVLVVDGQGWGGAVSFRKPVTFGISVGLLLWTCGWIMDRLPDRRSLERALAITLIGSGLIEVALITVQTWRGVPSHFNIFTPEDNAVFVLMAVSIGVFSLGLAALFLWSILQRPSDRPTRLAVLAGMALVMTGLGLGAWIIELGLQMTERLGRVPDTVLAGEAGVVKFPHAMALHGIQVFIGASLLGVGAGLSERRRLQVTRLVVGGYGLLLIWAILHTNAGRAPADLTGVETALLILGTMLMAGAGLLLLAAGRAAGRAASSAPVKLGS
ncbi:MAG: hypothetical protein L0Z63_10830 [Actinobacteria bacterium]|nr:hypothetical protein [Actinomycetota bacterium]